jgi:hypothetical protein
MGKFRAMFNEKNRLTKLDPEMPISPFVPLMV